MLFCYDTWEKEKKRDLAEGAANPRDWLFRSLTKRHTPENVAYIISKTPGMKFSAKERDVLSASSSSAAVWMPSEFRTPVYPDRQIERANLLFKADYNIVDMDAEVSTTKMLDEQEHLQAFLSELLPTIKKVAGKSSFKDDRISRGKFKKMKLSRRRYNRMFRFLGRFEKKIEKYGLETRKFVSVLTSKSGQAHKVTRREFMANVYAGAFMAYYSARSKRRSVFTNESQDRPYDNLCDILLKKALAESGVVACRGIAKVMPHTDVLAKLRDKDKLELLSSVLWTLYDLASMLKSVWEHSRFDRERMIVSRGDDSSTWNSLAGAWNSCRSAWVSLNYSLGLDHVVENMCIGKVMRLMAADVTYWHRSGGGDVDPDTKVWGELPAPWDVLCGGVECTADRVRDACKKAGVDPVARGWVKPPEKGRVVVPFKPTPNLVHGVVVSDPSLAILLNQAGVFSGNVWNEGIVDVKGFEVKRDKNGFALGVNRVGEVPKKRKG